MLNFVVMSKAALRAPRPAIKEAAEAYADIFLPLFDGFPKPLLHWGHPAAMLSVLLTMGLYGTYLGLEIKKGEGGGVLPLSLGETSRDLHPKVMLGAFFFFVLGGQGGLVLNQYFANPTLDSPHAMTAGLCLCLFAVQALSPLTFGLGKSARDLHVAIGSLTMLALFLHAALGVQLGLSF